MAVFKLQKLNQLDAVIQCHYLLYLLDDFVPRHSSFSHCCLWPFSPVLPSWESPDALKCGWLGQHLLESCKRSISLLLYIQYARSHEPAC